VELTERGPLAFLPGQDEQRIHVALPVLRSAGTHDDYRPKPVTLVIRSKDAIAADLVRDLGIELHRPEDLQQWAQEYARAYGLQVIEAFGSALISELADAATLPEKRLEALLAPYAPKETAPAPAPFPNCRSTWTCT